MHKYVYMYYIIIITVLRSSDERPKKSLPREVRLYYVGNVRVKCKK